MKERRKRYIAINLLLTTSLFLGSCSMLGSVVDTITWPPRKLWSVIDDKFFKVKNEQQTDMGPRRKPASNPGGGGYVAMPAANSGALAPPAPVSPGYPQDMMQQNNRAMPPVSNPYAVMGGPGQIPAGNAGGYPPMPPMPSIPQQYQQSPYGNPATGFAPPSGIEQPIGLQAPDIADTMDADGGADAAYSKGMLRDGGGKSSGWKIPFFSGRYKMEQKFEPLAAQFVVAANDPVQVQENINSGESILEDTLNTQQPDFAKAKAKKAASMFPLEQYAPKQTGEVKGVAVKDSKESNYPKLGFVPQKPENINDSDEAGVELEKMVKEANEVNARQANIHRLQNEQAGKNDSTKPTSADATISPPNNKVETTPKSEVPGAKLDTYLVKRRKEIKVEKPVVREDGAAVAPNALKNDAVLMKDIVNQGSLLPQPRYAGRRRAAQD